jgi:hypothetical protein
VVVLVAFIAIASFVGTISGVATMIHARKLMPKTHFGPYVSIRERNVGLVVTAIGAAVWLVGIIALMVVINTPSEHEHHSTYVLMFIGLGVGLIVLTVGQALFTYSRQATYDAARYSLTGKEKPPRHPHGQSRSEPPSAP